MTRQAVLLAVFFVDFRAWLCYNTTGIVERGDDVRYLDKERLRERVCNRVTEDITNGWVDNVALAVWQDGHEMLNESFGNANARTVYNLASMTKPVTAVAALIAAERGLLSLDEPIENYYPAFADRMVTVRDENGEITGCEPARRKITPRLLLCHSAGYPFGERLNTLNEEECRTLENSIAVCASIPLAFQPGESHGYSATVAWDVLVRIIERVTGEDYQAFITRAIFAPCDMADTAYTVSDEQWERMVTMHRHVDGKSVTVPTRKGWYNQYPSTHYLGCAGLFSTLSDYMNFALMLQNGGVYNGRRVMSETSAREMATPQLSLVANPGSQPWGLGVRVIRGEEYGLLPAGSFGWSGAYGTHFWVDPVNRITAVYMKNSLHDGGAGTHTATNFEEDVHNALI
ncbi:MAG: beta-lactamase family protein [Ruminococcaceae bacterium]|nr:beta-lactamase family protein [Oscillospiraceae bacterium]